jgi:hypothetical protein
MKIDFQLVKRTRNEQLRLETKLVACGGWSGRDGAAVRKHIEELAKLGVARPSKVPIIIPVSRYLLTQEKNVEVQSQQNSGEVEYVILLADGKMHVTVGSDHTDRKLETFNVEKSKQACPKILAKQAWLYEDICDHWDEIVLRSYATKGRERVLYQEAKLEALIDPDTLLGLEGSKYRREGAVIFSGTIPTMQGIIYADRFEMEMQDPKLSRSISHDYYINVL